jgi:hypothetical protein
LSDTRKPSLRRSTMSGERAPDVHAHSSRKPHPPRLPIASAPYSTGSPAPALEKMLL